MFFKALTKNISLYFILILAVLASTLILWLPFLLKMNNLFGLRIENANFLYIYKHYDGPLYIIPAKTLYLPSLIDKLDIGLAAKYFAAHLPFYPLFIGLLSPFAGYLKSMVFVNVLFSVILTLFFYLVLVKLKLTSKPLILVLVFLFLPRFLVIRSIGAPESLFILLILLSLYFFEKKRYWLAGIFGGLATMTKMPGILLFVAYSLVFVEKWFKSKKIHWQWLGVLLIPLGLLGVFGIYQLQYHDFFAYFHTGGVVPMIFPYSVFNFQAKWVGTAWLEDIIFYLALYLMTVLQLKNNQHRSFFYFSLVFFIATIFVQHRDIARYSLPLWPMACVALEELFTSKKFFTVLVILLPAIYLYAWNFLVYNTMPIANWQPFL